MNTYILILVGHLVFAGVLQAHDRTEVKARAYAAVSLAYSALTAPALEVQTDADRDDEPSPPAKPAPSPPPSPEPTPAKEPANYKEAYELYRDHERPMVVMVTASWCPYCPPVRAELERMRRDGELENCSLVFVDHDSERATALSVLGRLPNGKRRRMPHVAVYYHERGRQRLARPGDPKQVPGILDGADFVREARSVLGK